MDGIASRGRALGPRGDSPAEKRARLYRRAAALGVAAGLVLPGGQPAWAQGQTPRIDNFGPYTLGMTLDQAKAAHPGGKAGACGDVAPDRQCLVLDAAVFEEPGRIFAVLDAAGGKVDRIVAQLDPQLTQRRAYRCVRLAEKVFALLVVVYGPKYKQSYDQNRRPLPAVAWDGEQYGRLVFESKCRNADEGNPRISLVDFVPEGGERPKIAEKPAAPPAPAIAAADRSLPVDTAAVRPQASGAPASLAIAPAGAEAPPPLSAPVGVVEQVRPGAEAAAAQAAQAALATELALAKGKGPEPETPAPPPPAAPMAEPPARVEPVAQPAVKPEPLPAVAAAAPAQPTAAASSISLPAQLPVPAVLPAAAPSIDAAVAQRLEPPAPTPEPAQPAAAAQRPVPPQPAPQPAARPATVPLPTPDPARQTAALPPVRQPTYTDPDELPEPPDTVAPIPFMMPEEEAEFSRPREAAVPAPAAPAPVAAATPAAPAEPAVRAGAASAPLSLLSSSPPAQRPVASAVATQAAEPAVAPSPAAAPMPEAPAPEAPAVRHQARAAAEPATRPAPMPETPAPAAPAVKSDPRRLAPVMTGGWRHAAPVPPARPWREREPSES
jgi:hypothetical protein